MLAAIGNDEQRDPWSVARPSGRRKRSTLSIPVVVTPSSSANSNAPASAFRKTIMPSWRWTMWQPCRPTFLGSLARRSISITLGLFTVSVPPEYRRHTLRALEPRCPSQRPWPSRLNADLGRDSFAARSRRNRRIPLHRPDHFAQRETLPVPGNYAGFGAALALDVIADGGGSLRAPEALSFVIGDSFIDLCGKRAQQDSLSASRHAFVIHIYLAITFTCQKNQFRWRQ